MPKTFGNYLRSIRERRRMTLKQVSDKSGVHISTVSRIERDAQDPTLNGTLIPISKALGLSVVTLLRNFSNQ